MTPQEQTMLQDLVRRVQQTNLTEKDPEAEQFLQQTLGRDPNALYILAQTVLVQKYALEQAKTQLDQLRQAQSAEPAHTGSFLGNLLGHKDPQPSRPAPSYQAPPPPAYAAPQYAPVPAGAPAAAGVGGGWGGSGGGGGSSFLRSAATTATGVAAGALAFEGIESLLHGFGHSAGFGGGVGGFGGGIPVEETVVNNYYGDPNQGGMGDRGLDRADYNSGGDRSGDAGRLDDANYDSGNDAANLQDASYDLNSGDTAADDLDNDPGLDSMDDTSADDSSFGGDDTNFA